MRKEYMMQAKNDVFERFGAGRLAMAGGDRDFAALPWNKHPVFAGVALKHLVTSAESDGLFSYHLVKIDPGCAIGDHVHDPQLETHEVVAGNGECVNGGVAAAYRPGTIAIMPPRVRHEVRAGEDGLLLFAKFMPPLC